MSKFTLHNSEQADGQISKVTASANHAITTLQGILESNSGIQALYKMKFEKIGCDPLDSTVPMNLVEQINQSFTYLASFYAAKFLFKHHSTLSELTLNLGTAAGSDIEAPDGSIAAEIFAATSPSSNNKMNKDIAKVDATKAKHKYVFFMSPSVPAGHYKTDGNVEVWALENKLSTIAGNNHE